MRVVNLEEMQEIERVAIEEFGFSEGLIIENVGVRGADFIEDSFLDKNNYDGEIVVLMGRGNNAADGLAIGRHLANRGHRVRAFILFPDDEPTNEQKVQAQIAHKFGVRISEVRSADQLQGYFEETQEEYFLIDAILGTGFRLPLSNYLFDVINVVNQHSSLTYSVDIASGIMGESGEMSSAAIEADVTMAIGLSKTGHYISDGAFHSGQLAVLDVGLPKEFLSAGDKHILSVDAVRNIAPQRNKFAHKNRFGHTLVLGGSPGLVGALIMSATSALKVGTGLVSAATWKSSYYELSSRVTPEIMTGLIPEPSTQEDVDNILKTLHRYDSIVIGPGIGISPEARGVVLEILGHFSGPVVVDADAIKVLDIKKDLDVLSSRKSPTIFTPHIGEFSKLAGVSVEKVLENPISHLKDMVDKTNSCFILKGPCSFLGFPNGKIYINYFPNDGMATGGSGDVLAGIMGGLLAQIPVDKNVNSLFENKTRLYESLCLGMVVHTLAGKHAASTDGVRSMSALSIIDNFNNAFKEINLDSDQTQFVGVY